MVTIQHVLQFNAFRCSERIRQMKADAFKTTPARKWAHISPDGAPGASPRDVLDAIQAGWKQQWIEYPRVVSHMAPKHERWQEYIAAKQEASRWLTAIHLLKFGNGTLPLKKDVRKAVRAGLFAHHVSRSRASEFVFGAFSLLSSTIEKLAAHPESFVEAEAHAAARQEAYHARNRK